MSSKTLLLLASVFAGLAAATPVPASELAFEIVDGTSPDPDSIELTAARGIFNDIQKAMGQDAYAALVKDAADEADAYFKGLVSKADDPFGAPLLSLIQIKAFADPSVFNSSSVLRWVDDAGIGFPNAFLDTSPQHYMAYAGDGVTATTFDGATSVQLETWALGKQKITPWYGAFEIEKAPAFFADLPEYGDDLLLAEMRLRDGTVFSYSQTGLIDLPDGSGIEFYLGMYLPQGTDQWVSDALTSHLTSEFTNWLRSAYAWTWNEWYL